MSDNINRQLTINLTLDKEGLSKLADALVLLAGSTNGGISTDQPAVPVQNAVSAMVPSMPNTVPTGSPAVPAQGTVPGMPQPAAVPPQSVTVPQNPGIMPQVPFVPAASVQNPGQNFATPQPGAVPTTAVAQEYSYDQLAVAAAGLVNQGKQQKLLDILHSFGVNAMTELPRDRYGAFATAIKTEGAVI